MSLAIAAPCVRLQARVLKHSCITRAELFKTAYKSEVCFRHLHTVPLASRCLRRSTEEDLVASDPLVMRPEEARRLARHPVAERMKPCSSPNQSK